MKVALVGATGLVGQVMLEVIQERFGESVDIFPFASSSGKTVNYLGRTLEVEPIEEAFVRKYDFVLIASGSDVSRKYTPKFVERGALVIDNSSAFRLHEDVPLVVPEVNPEDLTWHRGIVANPNCSTIQMVVALSPIEKHFRIERLHVCTYQSVSGAGREGMQAYEKEIHGESYARTPFAHRIFGNVIPIIGELEGGYNTEEWKLIHETKKILKRSDMHISATAVRVPVRIGHGESVEFELSRKVGLQEIESLLNDAEGVVYSKEGFFTPLDVEGRDEVFVSRVRKHPTLEKVFLMWIVADNLRKGAATNAVQIMQLLIQGF